MHLGRRRRNLLTETPYSLLLQQTQQQYSVRYANLHEAVRYQDTRAPLAQSDKSKHDNIYAVRAGSRRDRSRRVHNRVSGATPAGGGGPTLREHVTGRQRRKVHLTFRRSTSQLRPLFLSTRSGRKMGAEGGERERRWETPKAKIFTIERVALVCPCPPRQRRRKEEEPRRRKRGPSQVPSA